MISKVRQGTYLFKVELQLGLDDSAKGRRSFLPFRDWRLMHDGIEG